MEFGNPLEIRTDVLMSELGSREVLVRIKASDVCHTDVEVMKDAWVPIQRVVKATGVKIPGHEGVGIIEEVGLGVKRLQKGDRVGIPMLNDWCGTCEYSTPKTLTRVKPIPHHLVNNIKALHSGVKLSI